MTTLVMINLRDKNEENPMSILVSDGIIDMSFDDRTINFESNRVKGWKSDSGILVGACGDSNGYTASERLFRSVHTSRKIRSLLDCSSFHSELELYQKFFATEGDIIVLNDGSDILYIEFKPMFISLMVPIRLTFEDKSTCEFLSFGSGAFDFCNKVQGLSEIIGKFYHGEHFIEVARTLCQSSHLISRG